MFDCFEAPGCVATAVIKSHFIKKKYFDRLYHGSGGLCLNDDLIRNIEISVDNMLP